MSSRGVWRHVSKQPADRRRWRERPMMSNILRAKRLTLEESVQALLGRIPLGETSKSSTT